MKHSRMGTDGCRFNCWEKSIVVQAAFKEVWALTLVLTIQFISRQPEDLRAVFPHADDQNFRIGRLSASESVAVCMDLDALVLRHSAVVGATGSGKTSAVASMLQALIAGGWKSANIVVIDPHGEYARALVGHASVRGVLDSGERALDIPFWALSAAEILRVFAGPASHTATTRFGELVVDARRAFVASCKWLDLDPAEITPDTPVPFDLRKVWYCLDYENKATYGSDDDPSIARIVDKGDPASLKPPLFTPYGQGSRLPNRGPKFGDYGNIPDRFRLGLLDPTLRFLHRASASEEGPDPLIEAAQNWLGNTDPISVFGLQWGADGRIRCSNRDCNDALARVGHKVETRRFWDWSPQASSPHTRRGTPISR